MEITAMVSTSEVFLQESRCTKQKRERAVWKACQDSFLAPTYFSFFGLVNVQRYFKVSEGNALDKQLHEKMYGVLSSSNEVIAVDGHSWFQIENYSIQSDGSLCKIDYGGENDMEVLLHFLQKLKQIRIQ